jgi:hypothetical protein
MQQQRHDDNMDNDAEVYPALGQPSYPDTGFGGSAEDG